MSEIYVKKINETELVVDGDRGALQEMSVESAKYSPQFRNHVWDGRIRLVNLRNNTTLVGLYAHIVKFCADRNYTFVDQTEEHLKPHIDDISQFEQWVQSLKLPFEPREYQLRAAKYAIQANRGLLLSPTGSGKSLIFYMLVRWMLKHDRKVCLVVPSTSLVEQMISDFKEYAANDDSFDVVEQVHGLHSKIKTTDPYNDQCVVSTWQSLIKYDKNLFETWDAVFVDEAHSCVAKSLNTVVGGAINARYKIGMTGSLSSCVCHEFQITGLLGSVYQVTTTKQL